MSEKIIDNFDDFADYTKGVSPKILMIMVEEFIEDFDVIEEIKAGTVSSVKEAFFMHMCTEVDSFRSLSAKLKQAIKEVARLEK